MRENLDAIYYQPVRDRLAQAGTRGLILLDSSFFIQLASVDATPFSDGKPTAYGLPHLFEILPLLDQHGFVVACSEMVSFESCESFRDGSNAGRFFNGHNQLFPTSGSLRALFRRGVIEKWFTILPAIRPANRHEELLENIFINVNAYNGNIRVARSNEYTPGNRKQTAHISQSSVVHRFVALLNQHKDAGENSTLNVLQDLGKVACTVFYISTDTGALKMMRRAGAITLTISEFLESLRQKNILPLLGLPRKHHVALIEACLRSMGIPKTSFAESVEYYRKHIRTIQPFLKALDGIGAQKPDSEIKDEKPVAPAPRARQKLAANYAHFTLRKSLT